MAAEMIKFRNEQIKGRVGRKLFTIPKTNYKWISILRASEIGVTNLQDVVIMNVYINRYGRYHHAKSDLVAANFTQLEFYFSSDWSEYAVYFVTHPSDWSMDAFLEYIVIPTEIKPDPNN